jgi:histidine triad (HIT) family protein
MSPVPSPAYDPANLFAKIIAGEIPAHRVYEDTIAVAFMDIMPQGPGHTLVVPKAGARNLLDADPASFGATLAVVQKVARAVKAAFDAPGVVVMQFNEPAAGQTIFHLHFHVIPRFEDVPLRPHAGEPEKPEVLAAHAEKIKAAL